MIKEINNFKAFDVIINNENIKEQEIFQAINEKLDCYINQLKNWNQPTLSALSADIKSMKALAGRINKLEAGQVQELDSLMKLTREKLQILSDNDNIKHYSTYSSSYDKENYRSKFNLRKEMNELQYHLFSVDSACVDYYMEKLKSYPEKLREWKVCKLGLLETFRTGIPFEYENFEFDLTAYAHVISKKIGKLTEKEKADLKERFSFACAAIEKIKNDSKVFSHFSYAINFLKNYDKVLAEKKFDCRNELDTVRFSIQAETGVSLDTHALVQFAALIEIPLDSIGVLKYEQNELKFCKACEHDDQQKVRVFLENICLALTKEIDKASPADLVKMKIVCGFLMANYKEFLIKGIDLTESNFYQLCKINEIINEKINKDESPIKNVLKEDKELKAKAFRLQSYMSNNIYFQAFWKNPAHVAHLKKHLEISGVLINVLQDEKALGFEGLTFLAETSKSRAKLRIYEKEVGDESNKKKELFVFSVGAENNKDYWNPSQKREVKYFNLIGHPPVLDNAKEAFEEVQNLKIDFKEYECLTFAGFGLDGAVAQLLGYKIAKENSKIKVINYCLGTPAFLTRDSASAMSQQKNLYAINFALMGDKRLNCNYDILSPLQKKWSSLNFITYPMYNNFWNFSNFTGHDKQDYWANAESSLKMPIALYEIYKEFELLLK